MEKFTVKRDDLPPLRFEGELIASQSTSPENVRGWMLAIYRTKGGNYVSSCVGWSKKAREREECSAVVSTHPRKVVEFFDSFGLRGDAHEALIALYVEAGNIDYVEEIE